MEKEQEQYILGIDGGGTKTAMVLSNTKGDILSSIITGQSNIHNASAKSISLQIRKGVNKLLREAHLSYKTKFSAVGVGLAGLDSQEDCSVADKIFRAALRGHSPSSNHVKIVNDTVIGFWSGSEKKEGMCIIGGTGSNCLAITKSGKQFWASGLGHILADEGSGFHLGLKTLKAAVKSFDGRGEKTILEKMVLQHFKVKTMRQLVPIVYYQPFDKHDIGKLAYLIEEASLKGDKVAKQIAIHGADELVAMVRATGRGVGFKKNKEFDLVMIGGVITHDPIVSKTFKKEVKKIYPKAKLIYPKKNPVMGAIRMAISTLKK